MSTSIYMWRYTTMFSVFHHLVRGRAGNLSLSNLCIVHQLLASGVLSRQRIVALSWCTVSWWLTSSWFKGRPHYWANYHYQITVFFSIIFLFLYRVAVFDEFPPATSVLRHSKVQVVLPTVRQNTVLPSCPGSSSFLLAVHFHIHYLFHNSLPFSS